ncbi:UvrD-helicase domain-containing protein [Chromobacterium subtsugae]|uniref:DNA 3'-5' helicase n=1 Tax=Chromobacterium subtsugae TaxID=251747 RepID=A0ABS7F7J8_9NEIS|nr:MULTISPECIES: UvrD-helicase domain-containing protein [Chromobacterium]KUM02212.1 DNA helicase II [Chromobacterium subtsugae]KZE86129.1 DNA helicase II [Chromobacterium sp. F49]MBW7568864.1 UvrD-helicase domain-containing protein [Chromobacterium subtsugae]MBW8286065.1 UvrD-helicase domain-containing protein [Chromobacterium subtsugae]WSE91879.1 UvrD-helicase domain-containing protein [Chromobacterium subtsugae]
MSDLLAGLNPEQLRAVTWPAKSALVLAGAGSGKTRVLTTRIAWLLSTAQTSPAGILAVTFTNKAAREMQTRLSAQVPVNVRTMWIGTFHGLCNRLLRIHYRDAGLPQTFQILDSADQQAAIKRLLKSLELSDEKYPPRAVQSFINGNKEAGVRAEALPPALNPYEAKLVELYAAYDAQCRREGVVDFAELLLRSYELLSRNEALRAHYSSRFAHILVDEFQDTNRLQYAWLKLLAGEHGALFAVGDDDQSIYAFRGAEVGNMRALLADFHVAEPVRLEQNYRSMGTILNAANALIEKNDGRLGKNLWTDAGEGEKIRFFQAMSDGEEAEFIVDEVKALRRDGLPLSDVAVLYRSNAQSRLMEHVLVNAQIPYRIYGGLRFFERQEIKHALAYLRLVANPDDDNALLRVINTPARGIGARSVEGLQAVGREQGVSLWQAACQSGGGRTAAKVGEFVLLIERLREQSRDFSLAETISLVIDRSGLRDMYEQDKKDGEERLANLDELVNAAASFLPDEPSQALTEFLTAASLEAGEHQADAGSEALQLMTVHAAKGLEFDAVFVTGLEEGLFPHENSLQDGKGLQEERRLMYVAVTRARKRLYLSSAQSRMLHGQSRYPIPSRFIDEIPAELIHSLSATVKTPASPMPARAAARTPRLQAANAYGLNIGQSVSHAKFGVGVVIQAEGSGEDVRLQINFAEHGVKWLDLRYAKLTPA